MKLGAWMFGFAVLVAGCGGGGSKINMTASFYSGATPVGHASALTARQPLVAAVPPRDGNWLLSPDEMILTVTSIQLNEGGSGESVDVNCELHYDRTRPGLTKLADCPFTTSAGNYTGVTLGVSATYQVLIQSDGFYSTANGLVTSPPPGGAQYLTVTTNSSDRVGTQIPAGFVVAADATPTLSVVVNGNQFFRVYVAGGTVSLGMAGITSDPARPDMIASVDSLASLAFYSNASADLATSGAICAGGACAPPPTQGVTSVLVFYAAASAPVWVQMGLNGSPTGCPPIGPLGAFHDRGYLGLDGTNTLGWAVPTDDNYTSYTAEFAMHQVTTLGASTTLACKKISTDPAPSGGSFASGAPSISAPDFSSAFILVAD